MTKDRRLGRGLAALLGTPEDAAMGGALEAAPQEYQHARRDTQRSLLPEDDAVTAGPREASELVHLNVYEIDDNPFQPRREFSESEIASLSESLKEHDMLQPILVRRVGERYQLISGERRLRAAIQAGWATVPARLREADDRLVAELAIVENLQRKDLNPIEKALSFKRYLEEHQCTQDDLARRLKIDRSTIANLMRLLELPAEVLDALRKGDISAGHARALLPLGDEPEQIEFCHRIQQEGLSVRSVEQLVQDHVAATELDTITFPTGGSKTTRAKSNQLASLEQHLRIALGTKTEIRQTSRGGGRIIVHFGNAAEFERLQAHFLGSHQADRLIG